MSAPDVPTDRVPPKLAEKPGVAVRGDPDLLRASEARFRQMADTIPHLAWIADPCGHVVWFNQRFYQYTGVTFQGSAGWAWETLVEPAQRERVLAGWRAALAAGHEVELEFPIRGADGQYRNFLTRAVPLRDAAGRVTQWFGTNTDVDALKRVEEAVRESDDRFRNLLQSVPTVAIQGYSLDGTVQYWNRASETFYGYSQAEAIGGNLLELIIPPEMRDEVRGALAHVAAGGDIPHGELSLMRKDGSRIAVYSSHAVVRPAGRPAELFCIDVDLTERKQAEDKLREQATVIEQARDPIHVRDLEQRITFWNPAAEKLLGWSAAEAIGRTTVELLRPDPARFAAAMHTVLQEGAWAGEMTARSRSGTILTLESRWTLLRDAAGRPKSILSIDADVSDRKRAEQQLLRAQRLESIGTLAGGIAHDLNNLLSPITIGTELLRTLDPHPDAIPILENMGRAAQRCADLVKQVLSFTRGVTGAPVSLQVTQVLQEVEAIIVQTFPRNIAVTAHCDPDLWRVRADATQINQVLLNLCVNARDAMPQGGSLRIRARNEVVDTRQAVIDGSCLPGRYVRLEVEDTGCGMPPQVVDRIFEPFFTTKEFGKGTGLGLSTVLGIVRSHRGHVNVTSEPGRGSTFKVYLPALKDEPVAPVAPPTPPALLRGDGELILLVEDEPDVLAITRTTLTTFGYRVVTAVDGADALNRFEVWRSQIRLVITDMMMPVMDGAALIGVLRRQAPAMPIIAASGMNLKADAERAAAAGAGHFVAKPYAADQLLQLVRTALHGQG